MDKAAVSKAWVKKYIPLAAAVLGIGLMVIPKLFAKEETERTEGAEFSEVVCYSERLEEKIEELICSAVGVGNAKVVLTLDGKGEQVYAQNEKKSDDSIALDYVIINTENGEEAVSVREIYPRVRGVAVVCDGGENASIKEKVTELISAALGISANKIAVSG